MSKSPAPITNAAQVPPNGESRQDIVHRLLARLAPHEALGRALVEQSEVVLSALDRVEDALLQLREATRPAGDAPLAQPAAKTELLNEQNPERTDHR